MMLALNDIDAAITPFVDEAGRASGTPAPGFAFAVCHEGETLWKTATGFANLELGVPISTRSVFHVASVSKQVTAICIGHLVRDGRLSMDDDVRAYVPELPEYGTPIRIRHLIHHTSGLRDDLWLQDFSGWRDDAWVSPADALDLIYRQQGLSFQTNTRFFYTNAGYSLLALIVERVSEKPFARFARENIFDPLAMFSSRFVETLGEVVPNRATGYSRTPDGDFRTLSPEVGLNGAIGLLTTVEDFAKWFHSIESEIDNDTEIGRLILKNGLLDDGTSVDYSLGFFTGVHNQLPVIRHGGSHGGYRSHMMYHIEKRIGLVCFANSDDLSPGLICDAVTDAIFGQEGKAPEKKSEPLPILCSPLRPGVYFEEEWGAWLHIREQEKNLILIDTRPRNLSVSEHGEYQSDGRGMSVRIRITEGDAATRLLVYAGAADEPDIFNQVNFRPLQRSDLEFFTGQYWSQELGALYQIEPDQDEIALRLTRRGHDPSSLYPVGNDTFSCGFFVNQIALAFSRNDDGNIQGFALSSLRTRDVRFVRAPFVSG